MTTSPGSVAIEATDLVKAYPGGVRALDGVTFAVGEGEVFALLGPNGAGKTTTVRILTTLSQPTSGVARVAGFDVVREPARVRKAIGVVSQQSGVDPTATGRENLVLQGRFFGLGGRELNRRIDQLLAVVGLTDAAKRMAGTYSGGMTRRLDIAMGLVHRPRVLFLDEPTTGLDPEVRVAMWDEIRRLAAEEHLTILLTTHYLEEADRLAGRLAILDRGKVVTTGTPEALKAELRGDAIALELRNGSGEAEIRAALAATPGLDEHPVRGPHRPPPGRGRRHGAARRPVRPRYPRDPGGRRHRRPTLARRRLPPPYRPLVRGRRAQPTGDREMTVAVAHTSAVATRHIRTFIRQPWWIAISLMQPLIYLLLFGQLFQTVGDLPAFRGSYLDFLLPGRRRDERALERRLGRDDARSTTSIAGIMGRMLVTPASRVGADPRPPGPGRPDPRAPDR